MWELREPGRSSRYFFLQLCVRTTMHVPLNMGDAYSRLVNTFGPRLRTCPSEYLSGNRIDSLKGGQLTECYALRAGYRPPTRAQCLRNESSFAGPTRRSSNRRIAAW